MHKKNTILLRTNSLNEQFVTLVNQLDQYLAQVDGEDHAFYHQFNQISNLNYVIVCFEDNMAVACGAIKPIENNVYELKRMFADPTVRGKGAAYKTLCALEEWAAELGASTLVLETGKRQMDAVKFYQKNGYNIIENYGQYAGVENSICFSKSFI